MRPVRDKLWYLRQINVFAELDDAELHRLAERTTMREVRRGEVICHPSEQPQQLYLIYRVDIDRDLPVAQRFGVMSIPTVLVLRAGKEVARLDGLITEDDLRAAFDRAIRG